MACSLADTVEPVADPKALIAGPMRIWGEDSRTRTAALLRARELVVDRAVYGLHRQADGEKLLADALP